MWTSWSRTSIKVQDCAPASEDYLDPYSGEMGERESCKIETW